MESSIGISQNARSNRFWNESMRTGKYRYYDNGLYFFALLALSGNYRIY